jgi:uncharacterized protein YdhG (YjbR/CyaY superfamily)
MGMSKKMSVACPILASLVLEQVRARRSGQSPKCTNEQLRKEKMRPMTKTAVNARSVVSNRDQTKVQKGVKDYLSALPEPARSTLNKVRTSIRSVVPPETEEVISYGIPAFAYQKILVWYAGFRDHCSLFPTASVIAKFHDQLHGYRVSKGTIQFPVDKPLPATLVKKIVKARLAEVKGKRR